MNTRPALQQRGLSVFVQDDIRVTSKLKLNVGLRWDYAAPVTDRFNALSRGFDFTDAFVRNFDWLEQFAHKRAPRS